MTCNKHTLDFSISVPMMANLRYQTILGLVVAPPGRRDTPAFVDSCPVLHIARATSPNCTHQNQNTQVTWRNGIAKNAVNLSQSRKGPRPACRMSSKELPVWRNNTRDWSRWSDSSWASQSHSPARGISAVGKIFPFFSMLWYSAAPTFCRCIQLRLVPEPCIQST